MDDETFGLILNNLKKDYSNGITLTECAEAGIAYYEIKNFILSRWMEYKHWKDDYAMLNVPEEATCPDNSK